MHQQQRLNRFLFISLQFCAFDGIGRNECMFCMQATLWLRLCSVHLKRQKSIFHPYFEYVYKNVKISLLLDVGIFHIDSFFRWYRLLSIFLYINYCLRRRFCVYFVTSPSRWSRNDAIFFALFCLCTLKECTEPKAKCIGDDRETERSSKIVCGKRCLFQVESTLSRLD